MSPPSSTGSKKQLSDASQQWPLEDSSPSTQDNSTSVSVALENKGSKAQKSSEQDYFDKNSKPTLTPPINSLNLRSFGEDVVKELKKNYQRYESSHDKNGQAINIEGQFMDARAHLARGDYAQAIELYDKIIFQLDTSEIPAPVSIDPKKIIEERQEAYQRQLSSIKNTIEESFVALDSVQLSPYKSPKQRFEELNQLWPHFEANIATLLQKASEVKNTEDRRFLLTLLFNKTAQCPQTLWFGELSEKLLLKIFDSIELSLRKKASHKERLETYYSLLVSLDSVKMDSLQQRIVSQGDAVAAKLSQVASDGKSTTQRVNDLVLAQKYYQRRGKSQAVQEIDLQLRRQQDVISRTIKSDSSPASTKLAKLSSDIDQTFLEHHETKPTGEGLLSPMLRAERYARHLAERAMLELQLKDKSSFQRWATVQELSLQAARDQQEAQLKDSALNPEILKIAHPLLQEKLLDPLLQEFFFAQNQEDILASGLESESRLPDDFEERQKTLSLFKQRYAKALSKGDTAWMLRYLSAHGLSSWSNTVKQAYQTSKRADASQGIVQLRLYHNAIAHFAQLGLETEVRQISQKILAQGRALLNHPETLHLNYRQASTMPEHFDTLDYWTLLLRVAKLCQNHKLPQESNFLLNEIIASQDQRHVSSQENFSDADIGQNLIDLAMAYRFENNGQRLQAQKLLQEIASRGFVIENLIENESPLTHLDSIELVATRPVIPATELKDKIEAEELFQSNMAAVGALSLYFAELEERYRIRAHSIRGQITDDVVRAYRADGSDRNDDLTRSLQKARGLCDKLAYKLITGEIKSLKAGLQVKDSELSDRELYDLMELMASIDRQFHGLQKNRSAFADLGFQDDIAPTLIEFVSTYPRNLKLAYRLLNLADQVEVHESGLLGPLAIYRLVEDLASEGEETWLNSRYISTDSIQKRARSNRDRLTGRADFAQATGKFIRSMDATEIAFEVGLLFVSGGLGSLVRTSLMRESASGLTKAALQRAVTPSLSFRIPALRHAASLEQVFANSMGFAVNYNTFNFGSIAHDMWVGNPDAEQMLYGSIARGITLVGFELGGPLSRALAERGARGLGMVQTTGHLSNAGQSLLRHGTHVGGLSVAMGAGTLNEELGLSPLPPGGPNEAYLIHAFGYAQLIWAKALVNKALGGKLAAFEHQPQLEYTVLLARHRVQIVLQKNKISISPAEEAILVDYLAQARLTRPDFNDQELSKLLNAIQGYVLANEHKGESDRLSFYRQAQALLDEAGVPLTLIAEEILTSNEARLLRFDWKNPQTAPAEKIELPEKDIPSTLEGAQANTDADLNNHASNFKNNLPGLGLLVFFWQGFAMPWISGEPADPITAPLIAGMVEVKDGKRKKGKGGESDQDANPDPELTTSSTSSTSATLAETQLSVAQNELFNRTSDDKAFLKALSKNPHYKKGTAPLNEEELKSAWKAFLEKISPQQARSLEHFRKITRVYQENGRRKTEPLLHSLVREPAKLEYFLSLSTEAMLGLEIAALNNRGFVTGFFELDQAWLKGNSNYGERILIAYHQQNLAKVLGRHRSAMTLVQADQWDYDHTLWHGHVMEFLSIGAAAQGHRRSETALRPLRSNPNLGMTTWFSLSQEKSLSEPVNPDLSLVAPDGQKVYREYKSSGKMDSDFQRQAEKYAHFIKLDQNQAGRWEYVFYSQPTQETITALSQLFEDVDFAIYVGKPGEELRLIAGSPLRVAKAPAEAARAETPVAAEEIPEIDIEVRDAEQAGAVSRAAQRSIDLSDTKWPYESVPTNMTEVIRSRFDGSVAEALIDTHPDALFYFLRGDLIAFQFESEVSGHPRAQAEAITLLTEFEKINFGSSSQERKLAHKARWLLEVIRRKESYPNVLIAGFKKHILAEDRDVQKALQWIEKQLNQEINSEETLSVLGIQKTRVSKVKATVSPPRSRVNLKTFYIYYPPEEQDNLEQVFFSEKHISGQSSFTHRKQFAQSAQARIFDRPQPRPGEKVLIYFADASIVKSYFNSHRTEDGIEYSLIRGGLLHLPYLSNTFNDIFILKENDELLLNPVQLDVEAALWDEHYTPQATASTALPDKSPTTATTPPSLPSLEGVDDVDREAFAKALAATQQQRRPGQRGTSTGTKQDPTSTEVVAATPANTEGKNLGPLAAATDAKILSSIRLDSGASPRDAAELIAHLAAGADANEAQSYLERLSSLNEKEAAGMANLIGMGHTVGKYSLARRLLTHPMFWEESGSNGKTRGQTILAMLQKTQDYPSIRSHLGFLLSRRPGEEHFDRDQWITTYTTLVDQYTPKKQLSFIQEHREQGHLIIIEETTIKAYSPSGKRNQEQFDQAKALCDRLRQHIPNAKGGFDPNTDEAKRFLYALDRYPEVMAYADQRAFEKGVKKIDKELDSLRRGSSKKPFTVYSNLVIRQTNELLKTLFSLKGEQKLGVEALPMSSFDYAMGSDRTKASSRSYHLYLSAEQYFALVEQARATGTIHVPKEAVFVEGTLSHEELNALYQEQKAIYESRGEPLPPGLTAKAQFVISMKVALGTDFELVKKGSLTITVGNNKKSLNVLTIAEDIPLPIPTSNAQLAGNSSKAADAPVDVTEVFNEYLGPKSPQEVIFGIDDLGL